MENLNIFLTIGAAGTGKTYQIINKIETEKIENFVILSPTHSSLHNLMKTLNTKFHNKCSTVYSYFRIDYENEKVVGASTVYQNIFIDEIGLIKKELFKKIIKSLWKSINEIRFKTGFNLCVNLYLYGDPIQLSPIYQEKRKISFKKLEKYDSGINFSYIIEHDYNSPFSLKLLNDKPKTILTKNYRSNDLILNLIHEMFYEKNTSNMKFISIDQVVNLILNQNYIFISSKYDLQKPIYDLIKVHLKMKINDYAIMNNLMFYDNSRFMIAETYKDYKNGDYLTCELKNKEIYLKTKDGLSFRYENDSQLKLLPEFLLTAHKSQGLSIENIIICVDELFDISMLYTMCTRARSNIYFYTNSKEIKYEEINENLDKFQQIMKFYKYID